MAYVTNSEIELFLGTQSYVQLTDDAGTGSADANKIEQARLGAEGEVNSYLATRYATPLLFSGEPEVQAVVKSVVLDLVSYRLHCRRPPVPADVVRRREEAVTWLGRVASGLVQLPAALAPAAPTGLGLVAQTQRSPRVMTRQQLDDL